MNIFYWLMFVVAIALTINGGIGIIFSKDPLPSYTVTGRVNIIFLVSGIILLYFSVILLI